MRQNKKPRIFIVYTTILISTPNYGKRKASSSIGFILGNYFFYHFIEAVDGVFVIFLFELREGKYLIQIIGNRVKNERSYTLKERIKDTKFNNLQD